MYIQTIATSNETPVEKTRSALIHCNETSLFENDEEQAGFLDVKYTWTVNGKPVQEIEALKDRVTVSGFGDLLISRFTDRDYGVYTCEVEVNILATRVVDVVEKNVDEKCKFRIKINSSEKKYFQFSYMDKE